jgi:DNA-binding response OmpR family regulator
MLSQNAQQAEFIKKGLFYENLNVELQRLNLTATDKDLSKELGFADGIFILSDDFLLVKDTIKKIRAARHDVVICVLTQFNHSKLHDWLKSGLIQFCFIRPFHFRQIASEMRFAIFAKREALVQNHFEHRDLSLDVSRHQVKLKNETVYLRNKEFSLLQFMLANKGKVLSKSAILENVWDYNAKISTNTVDVHICQLRRKIDKRAKDNYIRTIPCTGYILE